ncbi:hypothetical protein NQ314_020901 [Rhamnusium bicolor]|uniref:Uncharacterized protein n=1 Tax=Rhamnusium bicolor TaxID=1586634 RepID=A0AAV8WJP5_9CUCU|nr:hypothetical protein NQ314_020901 [Rhamnusium bicolor]
MVREEHVEEAYRKFCKGMSFSSKQKTGINSNSKAKVGPREKPNINTFAPEIVDLQNRKGTTFVDNIREMFNAKIIKSKDQFKEELNYLKPILIVNERNIGIINYSSQFAKSNIIYIVKENKYFPTSVLRNEDFISAFELGYLKLVDAQLFCKYIMGSEGFNIHEKNEYVSEHNYCISKNKYV